MCFLLIIDTFTLQNLPLIYQLSSNFVKLLFEIQTFLAESKGQLISKWFFGFVDFLQKTNEQIRLYYYDTSGRLVFVPFWRKSTTQKNHLEIN